MEHHPKHDIYPNDNMESFKLPKGVPNIENPNHMIQKLKHPGKKKANEKLSKLCLMRHLRQKQCGQNWTA